MNNDFNYRPQQPKPQPASDEPASEEPSKPAPDTAEPQDQPADSVPHVITSNRKGDGAKKPLAFLGILVLLAAVAGGVYYWQHSKVQTLQASQTDLQSQVSTLQSQLSKQKNAGKAPEATATPGQTPATTSTDIVSGELVSQKSGNASINADYLPGNVTEVWLEYGTKPTDLAQATAHQKVTSEGGSLYVAVPFTASNLTPGTQYFYRAAGIVGGKTVYGGVVAFQAVK